MLFRRLLKLIHISMKHMKNSVTPSIAWEDTKRPSTLHGRRQYPKTILRPITILGLLISLRRTGAARITLLREPLPVASLVPGTKIIPMPITIGDSLWPGWARLIPPLKRWRKVWRSTPRASGVLSLRLYTWEVATIKTLWRSIGY